MSRKSPLPKGGESLSAGKGRKLPKEKKPTLLATRGVGVKIANTFAKKTQYHQVAEFR